MKQRIFSMMLAFIFIIGCLPVSAAESISDGGSTYVTIEKGHYGSYLRTTDGNKIGARNWIYKTNDGITGPGYCVNYDLTAVDSSTRLTIAGLFTSSPPTAGAFASGYPQRTLDEFMEIYLSDYPELAGLTENEFANATQFAIWATLGQLAIEGTDFTTGRSTIPVQYGNAQNVRIYRAIQIILNNAKNWDRIYKKGLSVRSGLSEIGSDVVIENTDGIAGAAKDGQNGIKIENINGTEYYTREFVAASATSTWKHGYCIEIWAENAPEGTIFTDLNNTELATTVWDGRKLYKVPTVVRVTNLNDNGSEYYGQFKICMPIRATPESGAVNIKATSTASQFDLYLANNTNQTEQSYIIADPAYASVNATGALKWKKVVSPYGKLILQKVDGYGNPLSGAVFKLTGTDGSSFVGTSNENGRVEWEYLNPEQQYTLEEIQPPEGYIKAENQTVSVPGGQVLSISVRNSSYKTVKIRKTDAQNGASLKGATFRIESIDGGFKTDAVTSHNGIIELSAGELPKGAYRVYEINAPNGYEKSKETQTFKWDGTENVMITFENVRKNTLAVIKMDAKTDIALEGAVFDVYRDGKRITSVQTDNAGYARISGVSEGYYEIVETKAPTGYILDTAKHGVYVNPYDPATEDDPKIIITNNKKPSLVIEKLDSLTLKPMQNTTFAVYKDTKLIGEYKTDKNGLIELNDLEPGTYTVKEVKTDSSHIVQGCPQSIEVEAGKYAHLIFFNKTKPGISILKIDAETKKPLANAVFEIKKVDGSFVKEYTTDKNGEIEIVDLEPGAYTVTEVSAPSGYVIDKAVRTFEAVADGSVQLVFTNTTKPSLTVKKIDADTGKALSGAVIRITDLSGSMSVDKTTDESGQILLDNLDEGIYTVQEISAPNGYLLNDEIYHLNVKAGENNEIVISNNRKPSLTIKKYDSLNGKPMADTKFEVYLDTVLIGTYETNSKGEIKLYDLKPGTYTVVEVATDGEHIINVRSQSIEVKADSKDGSVLIFLNDQKPYMRLVKLDSTTMKPLANAVFKFKLIGGSFEKEYTTDENGEINLEKLDVGSYSVTEIKAPDGYVIDNAERMIKVDGNQYATFVFTNTEKPNLKIIKTDALTGKPIEGVGFLVKKADGETENTVVTDENGEAYLEHLEPGIYEVTEKSVPNGYLLDTEPKLVTLTPNKTSVVRFKNYPKPTLTVNKVDSITKDGLKGAKFHIVYASNNTFTGEINDMGDYQTDENGQIKLYNLKDGWYKITETEAPDGYEITEKPQEIYIKAGENKEVTFENTPLSGLVIKKVDAVTGKVLQGAKFRVRYFSGTSGTGGTVIGEYTTSVNGTIVINRLKKGTYIIEETKAPDGYIINDAPETVYITGKEQDIITVELENYADGGLVIRKLDSITKQPLKGAEFKVTTADGKFVANYGGTVSSNGIYTTDADGQIQINGIEAGTTLVVTEIKAPDGYVLDTLSQTVTIDKSDVQTLTFYNSPDSGLLITKLDKRTGEPLYGAVFKVTKDDGSVVGNGNGRYITDRNGTIHIYGLETDTYIVTEIEAPDGYTLDSKPQTIKLKSGETHELTFYNEAIGGIRITKVDEETGDVIKGVQFRVEYMNGKRVGTYTTNLSGIINIDGLENGWYTILETKAAKGYKLDTEPHDVEVKDGKISRVTITNRKASSFLIHKVDSTTGKGIYGVTFLISDRYGNPVATYTSDQSGYVYMDDTEISNGKYYIREISVPQGYVIDTEVKTFYVGYGETSSITWYNTPTQAQIRIIKKSADDNQINGLPAGSLLEGATFEIYDRGGNIVDTIKTDKNGHAASKTLPLGLYTVRETVAPAYYSINDTLMTANLEFSGQIVTFEVLDKSVSTGVSITKIGYNEVMPNNPITYTFKNIANTSSVPLESFYWRDTLPATIRAEKLVTGTYNQQLSYKIVYLTNLSNGEYRTINDNLSTSRNYALDISNAALGLANNEYITEIMFVFGNVKAGFSQVETPYLYARSIYGLPNGSSFVNQADVGGVYNGQWITSVSRWVTKVYNYTHFEMPKTGY